MEKDENLNKKYEPIIRKSKEWPVVLLSKNRKAFIEQVAEESFQKIKSLRSSKTALIEELETTLYRERQRVKRNPWKVDPKDEEKFWNDIKTRLVNISNEGNEDDEDKILRDIINRYANEISGNFKPSRYRVTREIVKFGFGRLLNASRLKKFSGLFRNKYTLQDKIQITGQVEQLRTLASKSTVIMVPTHFSNLDSILIGWIIHILGLPPFIYGAGLNLFNIRIIAYFMNSLGAYKVDRRKKNLAYIETLKTYSNLALQSGAHSLFFPGGTRSRSGKIEKALKLGLLGSAMEAQRALYAKGNEETDGKIYIVPVTLNYNYVLEAPVLINEHLRRQGQERYYVENDRFSTSYRIVKFLFKFFAKGSDISVSIGSAMDVLGNHVDIEGSSHDAQGRKINTRDYFVADGMITLDKQRETEYTRMLSNSIVKEYHKINRVFASHLVAFVAFQILRKRHAKLDLYNFLRIPEEDLIIEYEVFKKEVERIRTKVFKLEQNGKLSTAPHLSEDIDKMIKLGINNVGMYHDQRPLLRSRRRGVILTQSINTLYFYHNRMDGYDLEKYF
jgi:glycerol-3-phosphate O-acyltransferase